MTNITMLCANRPRLLKQALDSIGDLSDATVTIRDAGMNREVEQVTADWKTGKGNVSHVWRNESIGTGPARNEVVGISELTWGRGDYLYLSDDDVYFKYSNWLEIMTEALRLSYADGYRVVAAYNHPFNRPIDGAGHFEYHHFIKAGQPSRIYPVYAVATQSMLMDWETWDRFGPFCETPAGKVCQSEDVDFCNRIRSAGYKVGVISPALLVNTGITNSFDEKIVGWEMVKAEAPEGIVVE